MSEIEPIKSEIATLFADGVNRIFITKTIAAEAFGVRKESVQHWCRGSRPIPPDHWARWRQLLTKRIADLQEIEEASRECDARVEELYRPSVALNQDNLHFLRLRAEAAEARVAVLEAELAAKSRPVLKLSSVA